MNLKIICAWCRCSLGEKVCNSLDARLPAITHSICPVCQRRVFGELDYTPEQSDQTKTN